MTEKRKLIDAEALLTAIRDDHNINGAHFARFRRHIDDAPAVEPEETPEKRGQRDMQGGDYNFE